MFARFVTPYSFIEWIAQLDVSDSGEIPVNLHNGNALFIENKGD